MTSEPKKAATRRNAKRPTAPKKLTEKAVTKLYERTPQEQTAVDAMFARKKDKCAERISYHRNAIPYKNLRLVAVLRT